MVLMPQAVSREPLAKSGCCHHWLIEGVSSPTSRGICKLCGTEREFKNHPLDCLQSIRPAAEAAMNGGREGEGARLKPEGIAQPEYLFDGPEPLLF